VFHFEPTRVSLVCLRCGRQTPGWQIDVRIAFRPAMGGRPRAAPASPRLLTAGSTRSDRQALPEAPHSSRAA
jgi:hypothetical protein